MRLRSPEQKIIWLSMMAIGIALGANLTVAQVEKANKGMGYLQFLAKDSLGTVFIDTMRVKLPANSIQPVSVGKHVVRIESPDRCNWYVRDFIDTVSISSGDTLCLSVVFPRFILLNSQPYGAEVFYGDKSIGYTPLLVSAEMLRAGNLRLRKAGYLPTVVTVPDFSSPGFWVSLQKDERFNQTQMKLQVQLQKQRKRLRFWTYTSFSVTLLSGISALLTKKQADHYYSLYLQCTNPNAMQHYYHRTKTFDRYAGTFYVLFELSFITSIYLLMKNIAIVK